jgi:O-antigen/teichoic acid export membrane protein
VALTLFVMVVITNIDVVLVKHYADDVAAGEYSVGAVISRIAVFVPGVLLSVLFPQVSQNSADGKSSIVTLAVVMGLTILLSGSLLLIILFFPEFIIKLFFGEKYIAASEVLVIISLAMSEVAVLSVIFNFLLAKRMYAFLYLSYAILFVSGGYIYAVDSFEVIELIYVILYTCLLLLILNSLLLVFYWRKGLYSNAG